MKTIIMPLTGLALAALIALVLVRILDTDTSEPRLQAPANTQEAASRVEDDRETNARPRRSVDLAVELGNDERLEEASIVTSEAVMKDEMPVATEVVDSAASEAVPAVRRDPEVIAEMRAWWTERAQALQSTIASAARDGATSEDIHQLMADFQAEVERRYEDTARSMNR